MHEKYAVGELREAEFPPSWSWGKAWSTSNFLRKWQPRPGQHPSKPPLTCVQGVNAFRVVHHRKNQKVVGTDSFLVCFSLMAPSCWPIVGSQQNDESHMVWENRNCGCFAKPKPSLFYYFILFSVLEQAWKHTSLLTGVSDCRICSGCSCTMEARQVLDGDAPVSSCLRLCPLRLAQPKAEVLQTGTTVCSLTAWSSFTLHIPPWPVLMALPIFFTSAQMFCRNNTPCCKTFLHGKGCQTLEQAAQGSSGIAIPGGI